MLNSKIYFAMHNLGIITGYFVILEIIGEKFKDEHHSHKPPIEQNCNYLCWCRNRVQVHTEEEHLHHKHTLCNMNNRLKECKRVKNLCNRFL